MKKILIIAFTDHSRDPRVKRQINSLRDGYAITAVGLKNPDMEGVEFHRVEPASPGFFQKKVRTLWVLLGSFEVVYWKAQYRFAGLLDVLSKDGFDLVVANDINSLPFALRVAGGAKVLFDAHEYYPGQYEDSFWKAFSQSSWKQRIYLCRTHMYKGYNEYLCEKYIRHCSGVTTVCDSIAEEYRRNYGVEPAVITNACEYADLKPTPVDEKRIRIIHHGSTSPPRKIELMIEMMDHLDERFTLDIMMVTSQTHKKYMEGLKKAAGQRKNVRFIEPVPMPEIVKTTNDYDIGVHLLPPDNLNNIYALPNKFFEFIQARLAVAIGPSPEMAKITRKYDCGIVAEDFKPETLAKELNKLTKEKIEHYKKQSDKAAHELTSEKEMKKLNRLVTELVGG